MIRWNELLVLTLFFGSFIVINEVSSLKCYSCSSALNKKCIDPVRFDLNWTVCNGDALTDLNMYANDSILSKEIVKVYIIERDPNHGSITGPFECIKHVIKENGKEIILRGCQVAITNKNAKFCQKIEKIAKDNVTHCSTCNTDECNITSAFTPLKWLTILFNIVTVII